MTDVQVMLRPALLPTYTADQSATGPRVLHLPMKPGSGVHPLNTPRYQRSHDDTDAAQQPRPPGGGKPVRAPRATATAHPRPRAACSHGAPHMLGMTSMIVTLPSPTVTTCLAPVARMKVSGG